MRLRLEDGRPARPRPELVTVLEEGPRILPAARPCGPLSKLRDRVKSALRPACRPPPPAARPRHPLQFVVCPAREPHQAPHLIRHQPSTLHGKSVARAREHGAPHVKPPHIAYAISEHHPLGRPVRAERPPIGLVSGATREQQSPGKKPMDTPRNDRCYTPECERPSIACEDAMPKRRRWAFTPRIRDMRPSRQVTSSSAPVIKASAAPGPS